MGKTYIHKQKALYVRAMSEIFTIHWSERHQAWIKFRQEENHYKKYSKFLFHCHRVNSDYSEFTQIRQKIKSNDSFKMMKLELETNYDEELQRPYVSKKKRRKKKIKYKISERISKWALGSYEKEKDALNALRSYKKKRYIKEPIIETLS